MARHGQAARCAAATLVRCDDAPLATGWLGASPHGSVVPHGVVVPACPPNDLRIVSEFLSWAPMRTASVGRVDKTRG